MDAINVSGPFDRPVHLTPGIRPGETPEFHRLGEYVFQDLCRDILETEPDVAYCEVYGVRGQSQLGIDLLATRSRSDGYEVGQCKAYRDFTPAQIREASDEFLTHKDHWLEEGVRRFHLFVASDLMTTQRQNEIINQRRRFAEVGIEYFVWSATRIRNRLRLHPEIVRTYFSPPDVWVDLICGPGFAANAPVAAQAGRIQTFVDAATAELLERLAEQQSSGTHRRVEQAREAWRAGRKTEAIEGVRAIRSDAMIWSVLSPAVQSHVLRFEAALVLDEPSGLERARELVDEARYLAPEEDYARIYAVLEYRSGDAKAALSNLAPFRSTDDRNLAAGILLEIGRVSDALDALDSSRHTFEPNAETFRLLALAHALRKELDQARLAGQRAVELAPEWVSTRYALALIDYLSSLSPAALPDEISAWPLPIPPTLVRRDDQSIARLRTAAERFAGLAAGPEVDTSERVTYQTYRLACLANDPERQEEALAYCSELLRATPTHPGAIAWAVGREYPVDHGAVERALREQIKEDESLQSVLSLVVALLGWDRPSEAQEVLENTRERFIREDSASLWEFWRLKAGLAVAAAAGAAPKATELSDDHRQLRLLLHRQEAERTGRWDGFADALQEEHDRTSDPLLLFDLCRARARTGDWIFVADRAGDLVRAIDTPEALYLAVSAAVNTARFELCLRLLDENRSLFPRSRLPHELRTARIQVLQTLGELSEAAAEAEALARENPVLQHELQWAQILYQKGDLSGFVRVARKIATRDDLDPETALRLARALANEERPLATHFWRAAMKGDLPDAGVAAAVETGLRLGLRAEIRPLMTRFYELARKGEAGAQTVAPAELLTMHQAWSENSAKADQAFRRGEIPVHAVAERFHVPLSDLYHRRLEANERSPDPARQFALPVRHGVRGLPINMPQQPHQRRLHADVTALLLSAHLGILDDVERCYAPIRIPAETMPALIRLRESLAPVQPTRLEALREILELREVGALAPASSEASEDSPWAGEIGADLATLLAVARTEGGCVVAYLPIRTSLSEDPRDPPEETRPFFANPRAVVESLRQHGPLSEPDYQDALRQLGSEGEFEPRFQIPEPGSTLLLAGNVPELLAGAGILTLTCRHFRVVFEEAELEHARKALSEAEQQRREREWVSELIERLRFGIDEDRYCVIPVPPIECDADDEDEGGGAVTWFGLRTLLTCPTDPGDVIWVDDRWLTGFWSREGTPVFGTVEILKDLRERGEINEGRSLELLLRLRASNVRFIPLEASELAHHLLMAEIRESSVLETEALSILRRYVAAVLLDAKDWIQPPFLEGGAENPRSELPVLVAFDRAASDALLLVWENEGDGASNRFARADWIANNLLLDFSLVRRVTGLRSPTENDAALVAAKLASLISLGARIGWEDSSDGTRRRQDYFRWLTRRLLEPRFEADPTVLPLTADYVKRGLFSFEDWDDDSAISPFARVIVLRKIFDDLPEPIRDELAKDPVIMSSAAIEIKSAVEIGSLSFDRSEFMQAASVVVNGGTANITPLEESETCRLEPLRAGGSSGIRIVQSGDDPELEVQAPILTLLSDSPAVREATLRSRPEWFDGPHSEFENWVGRIASMEDPHERLTAAEKWQLESAALYYRQLAHRIRHGENLKYDDLLPPSSDGLLRHFRVSTAMPAGPALARFLNRAAAELVEQDGLATALERWWGLPMPLPDHLHIAVAALTPTSRRELFAQLVRTPGSPISDIHLLRLLWSYRKESPAYGRLVRRRAIRFLSERGEDAVTAHIKLMRWLEGQFVLRSDFTGWPAHLRLATLWLHAHRVYSAFAAVGANPMQLAAAFDAAEQRLTNRFLHEDRAYADDIASPARVSRQPLALTALAYVFNDTRREEIPAAISGRLTALSFVGSEDVRLPHPALLRDPALTGNLLGSYLSLRRQRPLTALLGRADARRLAPEQLSELTEGFVNEIRSHPDLVNAWGVVWSLIGDLAPDPSLNGPLADAILNTDFAAIVKREPTMGGIALQTAASIAAHLPDKAPQAHVRRHLLAIARALASERTVPSGRLLADDSPIPAARFMVQAAIELAKAQNPPAEGFPVFIDLLEELVEAWPVLGRALASFIQRAVDELPVRDAQRFARLLVQSRAA